MAARKPAKKGGAPARRQEPAIPSFKPRVVVKFHDFVQLPYEAGAEELVERLRIGPMASLLEQFPGITLQPLFAARKVDEIRGLIDRAVETGSAFRPANLLGYFAVEVPPGVEPEAVAKTLSSWQTVEIAYVEPGPVEPPAVTPGDDPRSVNQGYLDPAPDGIDAEFAWGILGGDGQGQALVDLEWGWTLNHEDLAAQGATLISGLNHSYFHHGTAVLGEVAAVDNTLGCVGITPKLQSVRVVGQWRVGGGYSTSEAILDAVAAMSFGDVLLLEAQTSLWGYVMVPVEIEPAVFDVIRLATALGIVVVEAAGNGGVDLDTVVDPMGQQIFNRASADFRDSGAIVVGAASSTAPHTRLGFSCHGSRIDCYGWGHNVDTCYSNGDGTSTDLYTTGFNGTSSASPIVTGAALAVQGMAEMNLGFRFSPWQLREILSDPANGTASADPPADRIGVMPDLKKIAEDVLDVAPDVYIRDHVGDTGDPHAGAISASPDIILRNDPEPDPQAAFGEGSGTENDAALGYTAEAGQDNHIYVRVRNRGGWPASNVDATVYWSPPATLVTPDLWNLVGSVVIPAVPNGDQLTVSDALVWDKDDIPATGHYCFVGLIGTAADPAPSPADFLNFDNFRDFIRNNNNVTWRNFNVVDNLPDPPSAGVPKGFKALSFLAPGAPDKARPMALEVLARLPNEARLLLEAPLGLRDLFGFMGPFGKKDLKRGSVLLPIKAAGRQRLGTLLFPARSRHRLRLLVQIPEKLREREFEVAVRQLYRDQEVGRVTWRLRPPKNVPGRRPQS
ncbi:MAG TPA: S8 family peptidase [Thermoanaerobaculia bacterium]|nr:S8 family peptidase [Thermoanaerobaculia bacterium]